MASYVQNPYNSKFSVDAMKHVVGAEYTWQYLGAVVLRNSMVFKDIEIGQVDFRRHSWIIERRLAKKVFVTLLALIFLFVDVLLVLFEHFKAFFAVFSPNELH